MHCRLHIDPQEVVFVEGPAAAAATEGGEAGDTISCSNATVESRAHALSNALVLEQLLLLLPFLLLLLLLLHMLTAPNVVHMYLAGTLAHQPTGGG